MATFVRFPVRQKYVFEEKGGLPAKHPRIKMSFATIDIETVTMIDKLKLHLPNGELTKKWYTEILMPDNGIITPMPYDEVEKIISMGRVLNAADSVK